MISTKKGRGSRVKKLPKPGSCKSDCCGRKNGYNVYYDIFYSGRSSKGNGTIRVMGNDKNEARQKALVRLSEQNSYGKPATFKLTRVTLITTDPKYNG